ncbi:MAG: LL-diaminopimelate aminotransferase [Alicyclobacillaceae bacterium]|nr:LL-diaminopimelate aminotransferase [Alicyclobacillaceae bacterium]MCY0894930.1 LL-diaminopimelate aminotransferase [Alicyclobacillaceae bacterium]
MSEAWIRDLFAERIGGSNFGLDTVIYKFERIKRAKAAALAAHPERTIIDMGVGEPDEPARKEVADALYHAALQPENRFYADNGIHAYKVAAARYLSEVYGVHGLNPETQINHSIGSKPALAALPFAFVNPGDVVLQTVPGYPVLATLSTWLGGSAYNLPIHPGNDYLPDLSSIPDEVCRRAKLFYLNYPNNPTGAVAPPSFFEKLVDFARQHHILVVHDNAYGALTFDGHAPFSFLSVPGAVDVGVEIHSMSKAFNMTGWRLGFVAGNEQVVKAFATVKDNQDSGQFRAIQIASAEALAHPEWTVETAAKYSRRHNKLVDVLQSCGFPAIKPKASFFLYVQAPRAAEGGPSFENAAEFSEYLIQEFSISTVPWDDAGHFVRFSVTYEADGEADEDVVMEELKRRLSRARFVF